MITIVNEKEANLVKTKNLKSEKKDRTTSVLGL